MAKCTLRNQSQAKRWVDSARLRKQRNPSCAVSMLRQLGSKHIKTSEVPLISAELGDRTEFGSATLSLCTPWKGGGRNPKKVGEEKEAHPTTLGISALKQDNGLQNKDIVISFVPSLLFF